MLILEFLLFTHFDDHPSSEKFVNYNMKWVHTGKEIADPLEFGFQK